MKAEKRVEHTKKLLIEIGLSPDRIEMYYMSSSMGVTFAETIKTLTERVKTLGPNPIGKSGGQDDNSE